MVPVGISLEYPSPCSEAKVQPDEETGVSKTWARTGCLGLKVVFMRYRVKVL